MRPAATYETLVSGHLLEIRDVRRRPAAARAWDTTPRPALVTGIESGPVRVEVVLFQAPFDVDGEGWDEAAEVSVLAGPRGVVVVGAGDDGSDARRIGVGGGPHRLQVYARGRSLASVSTASDVVETYRVLAWPAPLAPPAVLVRSRDAAPNLVSFIGPEGTGGLVSGGDTDDAHRRPEPFR
ncbi:hypothetical protein GCM10010413_04190 [Promicromonospora sukumoe]|uniref:Uncharacterized protein n=1 Tax=Promicromonospora sukumoe TaxID=88382 RepID=A0A7W3JF21_9MICO|nr:hypothetical protein [Promicromonospora sukumoe]MBA8811667.1 hypothetical protein [Promicromonospora sukumoe]